MLPTPPVAPVTKTSFIFSPNNNSSRAFIAKEQSKAVKPAVPNIIAFLFVSFSGVLTKNSLLTFASCA